MNLRLQLFISLLAVVGTELIAADITQRLSNGWEHYQSSRGSPWEVWRGEAASDNAAWTPVTLPHCFNGLDAVDPDVRYYQGPGWYWTRLEISNPFTNGRTLLHFNGAGQKSQVYVYTELVGEHVGGFDEWTVDVTDAVAKATKIESLNGEVPLAVRCDKSRDSESVPSDLSDFNRYGGLYRHVSLVYVPAVSIKRILVQPTLNSDGTATVKVRARLFNPTDVDDSLELLVQIQAPDDAVNHSASQTLAPWSAEKELCDELGLLVWEEVVWCRGGIGGATYQQQVRGMLHNMIDQHFNHPSVIMWGLGNKNDWPGDFEVFDKDKVRTFMSELNTLAHAQDPSPPTCIRRCDFCVDIVDVYAPSIWGGWYSGRYTEYRASAEKALKDTPHFFHAEWGGNSHVRRFSEDPEKFVAKIATGEGTAEKRKAYKSSGGKIRFSKDGDWSESYMANVFDWHRKEQEEMPWLTGNAQWILKDFSTPLRPENPVPRVNQKGLIERDGTHKESYYIFQSYWSDKPMVHIFGHGWPVRWGQVRMLDKDDVPCLDAATVVRFILAGDGRLLDNLGTSTSSRVVQLYNGRAQISVEVTGPKVSVAVSSEGRKSAFISITDARTATTSVKKTTSGNVQSKSSEAVAKSDVPASKLSVDVASIDRERILAAAAVALTQQPISITTFPAKLSQGGPNDFYSNGDYWWPAPSKPDGLPYIRRDGQSNPENFSHHRMAVKAIRDSASALAAAYKITGEEKYVAKAVKLLRDFFIVPETRMNPNLNCAQAIPGVSPGRGIGIIDALHLIEIPYAVHAMEGSKTFPAELAADLRQWFRELAEWMTTSKNGEEEAKAKNNHAVAFYLQVAVYADFIGDDEKLALCRKQYKEVFVAKQMGADGGFPLELERTKPYGYSIFQLDNMCTLCQVLSTTDDNLWTFELPDGRGIRKAVTFLYPFLEDKSKWTLKPDVQAWDGWPARQPALIFAAMAFGENDYLALWQKLPADPTDPEVQRNIGITQPILWIR